MFKDGLYGFVGGDRCGCVEVLTIRQTCRGPCWKPLSLMDLLVPVWLNHIHSPEVVVTWLLLTFLHSEGRSEC